MPTPDAPFAPGDHPGEAHSSSGAPLRGSPDPSRPDPPVGVLLMTYGSAATAEEVPAYLRSVRGGRDADPELVAEFQRRYRLIGWSPLVRITLEQGAELQRRLDADHGTGRYRVEVGMLHSKPTIDEAVARLAVAGSRRLIGIVLSPQWSPQIMGGYQRALDAAAWRLGPGAQVVLAGPWHRTPAFLDALAERVTEALGRLDPGVPVVFTAHSLPERILAAGDPYPDELRATAEAVAREADLERWRIAWQSAGRTAEPWIGPDVLEVLPQLVEAGATGVVVCPAGFVADHLEVLYDLDVEAAAEARALGLPFARTAAPNAHPALAATLARVIEAHVQ